jgi:pimeloyl-ACP methyl ester carboxylesterase
VTLRHRRHEPLSYLEAGNGNVPVLLVHGNFAGKLWWRELLKDPLPQTRLIAPDLPGFGESPGGRAFAPTIPSYARALARFLDALGLDRAVLVGHSFGAAVATQLALSDSGRFPGMFLISPAPPNGLDTPEYLYPLLESYRYDRFGLRQALRHTMQTRMPPYLDDLVEEARNMHPVNFSGNARLLSEWNVVHKLHRYRNHVLVASGNRDDLVSLSSAKATARAFSLGAYANLGSVGHSPQIEAPHLVRDLLSHLLTAINGRLPNPGSNSRRDER